MIEDMFGEHSMYIYYDVIMKFKNPIALLFKYTNILNHNGTKEKYFDHYKEDTCIFCRAIQS